MKRILITGKTGQVGWELCRTLAPLGEIIALGRDDLDLTDPDAIRNRIRETGPDVIVNAAAYTAVDAAETDPETAMAVNGTAPGIMAEEAGRIGAGLVHFSTDYVFDGKGDVPYTESDAPHPIGVYGRSKLAGEKAVQAPGAAHLIFRTAWVYGDRGKNFFLTIQRLLRERSELKVVDDQFGAPTWCRMIAEATGQILAQCREVHGNGRLQLSSVSGTYHLTCSGRTSWHGFAEAIRHQTLSDPTTCRIVPIPTSDYPTPAARPQNSVLSNAKLKDTFGIRLPDWHETFLLCMGAQLSLTSDPI
jgi:dTDP-4-dehydrorhamnose reductase